MRSLIGTWLQSLIMLKAPRVNLRVKKEQKRVHLRKKKHDTFINEWQVAEFLEAYINGTATTPNYGDSNWLENEAQHEYGQSNSTYNVDDAGDHADHNSNDDIE